VGGRELPKAEELYLRLVLGGYRLGFLDFSFDGGGFEVDADTAGATLRESRSRQRGTFSDSSRVIALAWRKGELIALKWGDLQFDESPEDPNPYILVQRNYAQGRFTSSKK
jgi:hypothetical protein